MNRAKEQARRCEDDQEGPRFRSRDKLEYTSQRIGSKLGRSEGLVARATRSKESQGVQDSN